MYIVSATGFEILSEATQSQGEDRHAGTGCAPFEGAEEDFIGLRDLSEMKKSRKTVNLR